MTNALSNGVVSSAYNSVYKHCFSLMFSSGIFCTYTYIPKTVKRMHVKYGRVCEGGGTAVALLLDKIARRRRGRLSPVATAGASPQGRRGRWQGCCPLQLPPRPPGTGGSRRDILDAGGRSAARRPEDAGGWVLSEQHRQRSAEKRKLVFFRPFKVILPSLPLESF